MFINFFFNLKSKGIPVSLHEWITLHHAMAMNLNDCSLTNFYHMARSILVKNEIFYDRYDIAFLDTFGGIETTDEMLDEILAGLKKVKELKLSEEEKKQIEQVNLDQVLKNFEEQMKQGHYKNHVGGNKAIGTGGRSTQGAWGYNPAGIRIGQGESRHKRAIQVAEKRSFRNYSSDITLDTRQMRVALSHLRSLLPIGYGEKLDLKKTIDQTCKNAGEIELVWENKEKKSSKVMLLMDVGGSMTPFAELVERLFSAAAGQINRFKHYYFHNAFYQDLWTDMERNQSVSTMEVLKNEDHDYKVIIVGDAEMAPSELTWANGAIDYWYHNDTPGIIWMQRFKEKFKDAIWLNPLPRRSWEYVHSIRMVRDVFPMFELTLDGLDEGVKYLMTGKCELYNR
ncbi:MAG TPA: VWA domain-containing protein [Spirochaetota bacterium]|nr:VWA domain-containing protein [Spirochaetota bacterium]HPF05818.1 VWA domain-containing protein [Spirochaetota bacterium]HPR37488.1 VWA domain-containing protein [Spirochaetota bacterium]HRX47269.1 VWA domain-containing protein [Spirochaetota bacterium]